MWTRLLKWTGQSAGIIIAVLLLGFAPSWHYGSYSAVRAMMEAGAVCFAVAWVGFVPLVWIADRHEQWLAQACLVGTVVRLLLSLLAALIVYHVAKPPLLAFALWLAFFYLLMLVWETAMVLKWITKSLYAPTTKEECGG